MPGYNIEGLCIELQAFPRPEKYYPTDGERLDVMVIARTAQGPYSELQEGIPYFLTETIYADPFADSRVRENPNTSIIFSNKGYQIAVREMLLKPKAEQLVYSRFKQNRFEYDTPEVFLRRAPQMPKSPLQPFLLINSCLNTHETKE